LLKQLPPSLSFYQQLSPDTREIIALTTGIIPGLSIAGVGFYKSLKLLDNITKQSSIFKDCAWITAYFTGGFSSLSAGTLLIPYKIYSFIDSYSVKTNPLLIIETDYGTHIINKEK
jgi:hypothetical protein